MQFNEKIINHWNAFLKRCMIKPMVKKVQLSNNQIDEVCNEIEHQWFYILMTRAVFTNKHFPRETQYVSPGFYSDKDIKFKIEILTPNTANFQRGASGLNSWHNKNYVIRLYGILEKYQIIYSGRKAYKNELMDLIYCLRPEIGAHGSGRKPKDGEGKRKLRKATSLINKLFPRDDGKIYDIQQVEDYWLPIDGVLEKMKDQSIEFVRSLRKSS
jgi:hypothetical protein